MHSANSKLTKIISLFLTFLLGFLTCAGAVFGVGYYAYTKLSYNKLRELGIISGDPSQYVDPNASSPITDMTLEALIAEISSVSQSEEDMTVEEFLLKYGLRLDEAFKNSLPEGVFKISFRSLFTADGIDGILTQTDAEYILGFIPDSPLGETLKKQLEGKSLKDVLDFEALLNGIKIGELMGYKPIYKNNEILRWENSNGDEVEATLKNVVELTVGELTDGGFSTDSLFDGLYVGDALGYTPHFGADGEVEYWTELVDAKDSLGNPIDDNADGITDKIEKRITGIDNGIANVNLGLILDDSSSYDIEDAFSGIFLGELMGYTKKTDEDGYYLDVDGNKLYRVDDNGNYFSKDGTIIPKEDVDLFKKADYAWITENGSDVGVIANKFSNYALSDILEGKVSFDSSEMTGGISIADIMEFEAKEYVVVTPAVMGKYTLLPINEGDTVPAGATVIKRWFDSDGYVVSGVLATIADKEIDDMSDEITDLLIANVLGYYDIGEREGTMGEEKTVWYTFVESELVPGEITYTLERASGLMLNFADLSVDDMSDNGKVSGAIKNVVVGEALGYEEVDGVWKDGNGEEVSGIMKNIIGLKVSEIDSRVTVMTVADVLGYERVNGTWYEGGMPITGIMQRLADARLNELNKEVHDLYFGDIEGYTLCKEETDGTSVYFIPLTDTERANIQSGVVGIDLYTWCSHDGDGTYTKAEGITVKFANLKIDDMTNGNMLVDQLQTVTLAEAFPGDYNNGFLSLVDPNTSLAELSGGGEGSLTETFKNVTIQQYMDAGLLDFGTVDADDGVTTVAESLNALDAAKLMAAPDLSVKYDAQGGFYYYDNVNNNGSYDPDMGEAMYGWRVQTISSLITYILAH